MEQTLLLIMAFGYFCIQLFWFFMDSRSIKERIKFYLFLQGNACSRIIAIGLIIFIFVKYINPNWMFSLRFESKLLEVIFSTAGMVLYSVGFVLCIWARITMHGAWAPAEDKLAKHKKILIVSGPFTFTRNPIYVGLLLIYSGFFISMKSYLIVIVLFVGWFFHKKILDEERTLEKDFGSDYLKYKSKVRRFI